MMKILAATLSTEAGSISSQRPVLEALINRAASHKLAGSYKSMYKEISGGFYGPWNRGETQSVMARGISPERMKQVNDLLDTVASGASVTAGMTDQGMRNEIKGYKEQIGEDWFGYMNKSDLRTQAYLATHAASQAPAAATAQANAPPPMIAAMQFGGIARMPMLAQLAEHGPEAVLPLSGARGMLSNLLGGGLEKVFHLTHSPTINIAGGATEEAMGMMEHKLKDAAMEFIANFKAAQRHERRLSYESGYGS